MFDQSWGEEGGGGFAAGEYLVSVRFHPLVIRSH